MDPAVVDQLLQGDPGHFPAHRVEAGNDHRFRRIVDDQVDTGQGLQGPDVPAFPADDPALHFIVGQGHYRNRGFRHLIRRTPLDGQGDDFPGLLVRGILGFLFHFLDQAGFVMFDFFPHIVQQFLFGFFAGEPGNPFQFHHLLVIQGIDFGLGFPQAVALFQKFFFLLFISIHLFVDVFFLLDQTPFIFAELCSSFLVSRSISDRRRWISSLASSSASFFLASPAFLASSRICLAVSSAEPILPSATFLRARYPPPTPNKQRTTAITTLMGSMMSTSSFAYFSSNPTHTINKATRGRLNTQ